nr:MAG TPA: hypothetical protein [Microviridae sp.]
MRFILGCRFKALPGVLTCLCGSSQPQRQVTVARPSGDLPLKPPHYSFPLSPVTTKCCNRGASFACGVVSLAAIERRSPKPRGKGPAFEVPISNSIIFFVLFSLSTIFLLI